MSQAQSYSIRTYGENSSHQYIVKVMFFLVFHKIALSSHVSHIMMPSDAHTANELPGILSSVENRL